MKGGGGGFGGGGRFCPYPPVGVSPRFGGGRTNTTGSGSSTQTFTNNTAPGPMTINNTPNGGTRIEGPGINGGTTQLRTNPDGSSRVDLVPPSPAVPETVHFK